MRPSLENARKPMNSTTSLLLTQAEGQVSTLIVLSIWIKEQLFTLSLSLPESHLHVGNKPQQLHTIHKYIIIHNYVTLTL